MSKLLDNIKIMLDITADCKSEDEKINLIIEGGKVHLCSINPLLTDSDFDTPTRARKLLFCYCRYAYSNATEMFDINYAPELLLLRQEYEVTDYVNQKQD